MPAGWPLFKRFLIVVCFVVVLVVGIVFGFNPPKTMSSVYSWLATGFIATAVGGLLLVLP